jgi:hypothetical protein
MTLLPRQAPPIPRGQAAYYAGALAPSDLRPWLASNGWSKGAGPNYYKPKDHPHLHAGLTGGGDLDFLAYSTGTPPAYQLVKNGGYQFGTSSALCGLASNAVCRQADALLTQAGM